MKDFELVQNFFCNMHCSKCHSSFEPEGIILLKEESNYFVVKISCVVCKQQVGIAIVGVATKAKFESNFFNELECKEEALESDTPPITYDDVIEAHHFFSNLGSDWMSHINKAKKDKGIEEE